MIKKCLLSFLLFSMGTAFAQNNSLCENLTGTWLGLGQDPTHLLVSPFPINLQLYYQNGKVYGYTLPAQKPANSPLYFGQSEGDYFFFADCKHNTLSHIYFIHNPAGTNSPLCGDPTPQTYTIQQKNTLTNFPVFFETAMTNATLRLHLTQQTQPSTMNASLLKQVIQSANVPIHSCM